MFEYFTISYTTPKGRKNHKVVRRDLMQKECSRLAGKGYRKIRIAARPTYTTAYER